MEHGNEHIKNLNDPRTVMMVVYPNAHILDVTGPLEVLTGASLFLPDTTPTYETILVANQGGAVKTTSGLSLQADLSFRDATEQLATLDTLLISGGHGINEATSDTELMEFVRIASTRAKRVVSICTGAMILAELGLLNGRRATTHWWWCPILAQKYPEVEVDADAIYVRDGNVWTSAGVTTGMDLALSLVEMDFGHHIALQVARYNVMYMMRPGGQSQFSAQLLSQNAEDHNIGKVLRHVIGNLTADLSAPALAEYAGMSDRTFNRKFKEETGHTPAAYVELARVQAARIQLEQSELGVELVALKTGFQSPERMRRAFHRHVGISAADYRERFKASGGSSPMEGGEA
ncbi:GlxA family transcriptional regulator [Kordiimonas sp.]|uniref:GlxA family transcriptional regulator n=1 Tax=Kordiimonas sp. TaxID=1970157 RepID=UPI003A93F1A3